MNDQYCTEIPKAGNTIPVVDLVDSKLRNEPVSMRVMKGPESTETEGEIVVDVSPRYHLDGVLRGEVRLDEGLYTVTIASETQNLMRRPQYHLRVQAVDYSAIVRSTVGPLIGVLLWAWVLYKLVRSKWLREWWAPPSS